MGEFQTMNSVLMELYHVLYFPILGVPDNNHTEFLVFTFTSWSKNLPLIAFCQSWNFLRVAIQFVHFWPQSVLNKIVVMRRDIVVQFWYLFFLLILVILLLFGLLFFIIIIWRNFFTFYSLHFSHETKNLLSTFSIGFILQNFPRSRNNILLFFLFRREVQMQIGSCKFI